MPTPEEIKKIAEEYGEYESKTPKYKYPAFGNPTRQQKECAKELAVEARFILTWLSKTHCIVPKSKVIGLWNEINNDAKTNIENGFPDYAEFNKLQLEPLRILFGTELFNEEKE